MKTTGTPLIEMRHLLDVLDPLFAVLPELADADEPIPYTLANDGRCPNPGCGRTFEDCRCIGVRPTSLTKVEPSLYPSEAALTSGRHRRQARKWPWSWRCTAEGCDDAYGAARTRPEARSAAEEHERTVHGPATALCPAAHPDDPTGCVGPPDAVTVYDYPLGGHGNTVTGCEHHATRLYAALPPSRRRVHPGTGGEAAVWRVYNAARTRSEEAQELLARAAAEYAAHQQTVAQGDAVVQLGQAVTSGNWAGGTR